MSEYRAAIERLYRRVMFAVGRGRTTAVNDAGSVQKLQVVLGALETRDNTPRLAEFGFTSNPPPSSDAVVLFVGGDRSNGVVIATGNQQYRLVGLASGDVAIYDSRGASVWLTPAGIVINGAGLPMQINNVPTMTQNGDLRVTGAVIAGFGTGDQVALQTHKHGGVQSGGSQTVAPVAGT